MCSAWARIKEAMGKRSNIEMAFYLHFILLSFSHKLCGLFLFSFFSGLSGDVL
jgi:hypothetical protein